MTFDLTQKSVEQGSFTLFAAGGESPLTLRPNFKCEKGNVTADKPPVCPAGGFLLVKIKASPEKGGGPPLGGGGVST